ncbi:hypothetical protein STPH2_1532 [Streptomyces sp. KO7888]|nr:hypothetical protein [Streptomyces sp. KO7888]
MRSGGGLGNGTCVGRRGPRRVRGRPVRAGGSIGRAPGSEGLPGERRVPGRVRLRGQPERVRGEVPYGAGAGVGGVRAARPTPTRGRRGRPSCARRAPARRFRLRLPAGRPQRLTRHVRRPAVALVGGAGKGRPVGYGPAGRLGHVVGPVRLPARGRRFVRVLRLSVICRVPRARGFRAQVSPPRRTIPAPRALRT